VPLKETVAVGFVVELLLIVNFPVKVPAVAGSNCTFNVSDCPEFNVAGKVAPEIEKPLPLALTVLTVTGELPVEVKVTGCDTAVFTRTLPNPIDVAFTLRAAPLVEGDKVITKAVDEPPSLAVMVAV
jgi:hypothetical protein